MKPYDVVSFVKTSHSAQITGISGVRVLSGGTVQALVQSGRCVAPSSLDVAETPDRVTLTAHVVTISDGPCTQQIVPVFVAVRLHAPLDARRVLDGHNGDNIRVADCRVSPKDPLCSFAYR